MEVDSKAPLSSNKYRVGWCGFEPNWLQPLNKAGWVLAWLFFANTFQSLAVNGLVGVVLSTLERRFGFTSAESAWIPGMYDAAAIPVTIYISYVGTRMHRLRWIFIGELIVFAGTLLFVLPHFATGTYLPDQNQTDDFTCDISGQLDRTCDALTGSSSSSANTDLQGYLAVFIIARVLQGMGAQPLLVLGTTFLDDVTTKESFSLYIAIFTVGGIFGPAVAYVLGGYALTIFTDFYQVDTDSLDITPVDARWIGAWWLDFLIAALCILVFAIPISIYARDLPGAAEIRATKVSEAHNDHKSADGDAVEDAVQVAMKLSDIPSYLKTILTNPSFMCIVVFGTCDILLIAGFTAFGPKYVETQFSQSPTTASILFGLVSIPGGIGGSIFGGWLIKRFKLSVSSVLKCVLTFTTLAICCSPIFFFQCDAPPFAGVTTGYNNTELNGILEVQECFAGCNCTNLPFEPVCGADNVLYFSPCHAGCTDSRETTDAFIYQNCSCVTSHIAGVPDATSEPCVADRCPYFVPFLIIFLLAMFFIFAGGIMIPTLYMRLVPATHRTMGLGVSAISTRLFGGLLGPLIFGAAFDGGCELWDDNCGNPGSCLTYNLTEVGGNITAIAIISKLISLVAIIIAWKFYRPPTQEYANMPDDKTSNRGSSFSDGAVAYDNAGYDASIVAMEMTPKSNTRTGSDLSLRSKRGSYTLST